MQCFDSLWVHELSLTNYEVIYRFQNDGKLMCNVWYNITWCLLRFNEDLNILWALSIWQKHWGQTGQVLIRLHEMCCGLIGIISKKGCAVYWFPLDCEHRLGSPCMLLSLIMFMYIYVGLYIYISMCTCVYISVPAGTVWLEHL